MRCCMNCEFRDPGAHNECREPFAEFVRDREKANFCGLFQFKVSDDPGSTDVDDAKARLEAMFKTLK